MPNLCLLFAQNANVITTLSNAIWGYFGHHQFPQQQNVHVTPVIKGANTASQISQNQYDDYQEDIHTLKQAYQSITAICDPIECQQELIAWHQEKASIQAALFLDYKKAHVLTKRHYLQLRKQLNAIELNSTHVNQSEKAQYRQLQAEQPHQTKQVSLSHLNGNNGFVIYSSDKNIDTGMSMDKLGDINGDGIDDFIIDFSSLSFNDTYGTPGDGLSYVLFGQTDSFPSSINLRNFEKYNGFLIITEKVCCDEEGAVVVKGAGDINNDGINDIIISTPLNNNNPLSVGICYIVFGKDVRKGNHFNKTLSLSEINGSNGFMINGTLSENNNTKTNLGYAVAGGGDINGDSIDDVVIGVTINDIRQKRTATNSPVADAISAVIYGKDSKQGDLFNKTMNLVDLNGKNGFLITLASAKGLDATLSVGDVNGDGLADILMSMPVQLRTNVYVLFGRDAKQDKFFANPTSLEQLNSTTGLSIIENTVSANISTGFGVAISSGGDVNDDNIDDMLIADAVSHIYVIYGQKVPSTSIINVSQLNGNNGFIINYTNSNGATFYDIGVNNNGDINGDGIDDIFIGLSYRDTNHNIYVIYGRNSNYQPNVSLNLMDKNFLGLWFESIKPNVLGNIISAIGDINDDGYDDLNIVAKNDQLGGGEWYVIFGGSFSSNPTLFDSWSRYFPYAGIAGLSLTAISALLCLGIKIRKRWKNNPPLNIFSNITREASFIEVDELESLLISPSIQETTHYSTFMTNAIKKAAKEGSAEAQFKLALAYELGRGIQINSEKAIKWYTMSAKKNNIDASANLHGMNAVEADNNNEIEHAILLLEKAKIGEKSHWTLLQLAIRFNCGNVMLHLLGNNADPDYAAENTPMPKTLAIEYRRHALMRIIHQVTYMKAMYQKKEMDFQSMLDKLNHQNELTQSSQPHILTDEQTLEKLIIALTMGDQLSKSIADIKVILKTMDAAEPSLISSVIIPLLSRFASPEKLLRREANIEDKLRNLLSSSESEYANTLFFHLDKLCDDIRQAQEQIPKNELYMPICQALSAIIHSYESYKQDIINATSPINSVSLLHTEVYLSGVDIKHCRLQSEPARLLLSHTDKSDESAGTHVVKAFRGVHFKTNPHAPGVEFMVNSLVDLIAGYGTPPTKLLKVYQHQQSLTYLASKIEEGMTLDFILQKHPELIAKIESRNFSSMFLLGLLINPQDGKADNYTVKFSLGEDDHIDKLYIIGIDNDIAFTDSIVRLKNGEHHVNVRNILYFLPQMQAHVDTQFRQEFLKLSAEMIVIKWLESLANKNNEYNVLQQQKIFDSDELKQYQLPIRLTPNLVNTLYQRIKSIQDLLTHYPDITHEQLFQKIDPILYEHYKKIQGRSTDPMDAICKLYVESSSTEKTINPHSLFYPAKLMTRLAHEAASTYAVEEQCTIPITEAMENFISSINFSVLSEAEQLNILGYLSDMEHINNFEIHGCSVLDQPLLLHMLDEQMNRGFTFTFCNMQNSSFC